MKKTIALCDRCGKEVGTLDFSPLEVFYNGAEVKMVLGLMQNGPSQRGWGMEMSGPSVGGLDLCPDCRKSFSLWFTHPEKEEKT